MFTRLTRSALWLSAFPVAAFLLIYVPDVGHGFISDDFSWIKGSRFAGWEGLLGLFRTHNGFYRPLVSLSFAANERLLGLRPLGYGLTNLGLALGCAAAIVALARGLGMAKGAGLLAACLWMLNPHGIGMSVLWISGRTSLLLTLFSLLAAHEAVKGRQKSAAAFCLLALFSKEEAVLLPAVLMLWAGWRANGAADFDARRAFRRTWPLFLSLATYLALRSTTGAYLPTTAPPFYRPSLEPWLLLRNVLEYTDRACTFPLAAALLLSALTARRPRLGAMERRWLEMGLLWLIGGYGLTVFLPVRSSLYACLPSVGPVLAAAAVSTAVWAAASEQGRRRALAAAALIPFLVIPIYRARNVRWVTPAEVSSHVIEGLGEGVPPGLALVLRDENGLIARAFGTLVEEALRMALDRPGLHVWLEPPPSLWPYSGLHPVAEGEPAVVFELKGGRLGPASRP